MQFPYFYCFGIFNFDGISSQTIRCVLFPEINIVHKNFSDYPYPVLTGSEPLPQTTALSLLKDKNQ